MEKIGYTTVEETGSASITGVAFYLDKLKVDLHVGEESYPQKMMKYVMEKSSTHWTKKINFTFKTEYS